MYDNEYFVVDMASCTSTGEIVNNLSLALETLTHSGKKIVLKLNDCHLNQSQMLSIQSLVTSYGCTLDTIETVNDETARVAEGMNVFVQKPIEKRVEEKYDKPKTDDFERFSMKVEAQKDTIALKDVNGLHFEADLDAIQKREESINLNIASDIDEAGINSVNDFSKIDEKVTSKFIKDELAAIMPAKSIEDPLQSIKEETSKEQAAETVIKTLPKEEESLENVEKNSIGVYKKAYDENKLHEEQWEEIDFYETPTNDPVVSDSKNTIYINQTLRSGQVLEADGNVVIIGDCHPGSEVRALGDITVWGVLSGIAHAGCKGNLGAKVRALKLNAVQLRIGKCYSRRPDGTNIPYIIRSSIFTPEEARVVDGEIMLFKINQN